MSPLPRRAASFIRVLLALAVGACAPGGSAPPPVSLGHNAITSGEADTPAHNAVVALILGNRLCSGTLITPTVALTAAHCLADMTATQTLVGFGTDIRSPTMRWVAVSELMPHPNYDPVNLINDIGLVRLKAPAPADISPLPWLPPLLGLTSNDIGAILTFAGFGAESGSKSSTTGIRMMVTAPLDLLCLGPAPCPDGEFSASAYTLCYNQQPGGPCSGDSGGPAFINRAGKEYVAGITSYGDAACATFGCSTRTDHFAQFISTFTGEPLAPARAQGAPCSGDDQCVSGFCSDGVCCDQRCAGAPCQRCAKAGGASADGVCTPVDPACDDGDPCTTQDHCVAGQCQGNPISCESQTPCRVGLCDPQQGGCVYSIAADGLACADASTGVLHGQCRGGLCIGQAEKGGSLPKSSDESGGSGCATTGLQSPLELLPLAILLGLYLRGSRPSLGQLRRAVGGSLNSAGVPPRSQRTKTGSPERHS